MDNEKVCFEFKRDNCTYRWRVENDELYLDMKFPMCWDQQKLWCITSNAGIRALLRELTAARAEVVRLESQRRTLSSSLDAARTALAEKEAELRLLQIPCPYCSGCGYAMFGDAGELCGNCDGGYIGYATPERIATLEADLEVTEAEIRELKNELRCPDCGCASPEDAEASECGCDSPVCERDGGKTLAQHFVDTKAERDTAKARVVELEQHLQQIIAPVEVGGGVVATLRARIAELEQERDEEQRQRKRANIAVVLAQEIIAENEVERERLREALREITKGEGAYSHDRFEHSCNTIDNMKAIARAAIEGRE